MHNNNQRNAEKLVNRSRIFILILSINIPSKCILVFIDFMQSHYCRYNIITFKCNCCCELEFLLVLFVYVIYLYFMHYHPITSLYYILH